MSRGVPDQVVISAKMTTEDARLLLRMAAFELGKAVAIHANVVGTDDEPERVKAQRRIIKHIADGLRKAGRADVITSFMHD